MIRQHYLIREEVQESSSFTHIHAGSTVAGAYGRGVALGRMKAALEAALEGLDF